MLLEDAKKIRAAKPLEQSFIERDKTTVTGIKFTKDGIKEVDVSLGSAGLEITEKKVTKPKTKSPRKKKKGK